MILNHQKKDSIEFIDMYFLLWVVSWLDVLFIDEETIFDVVTGDRSFVNVEDGSGVEDCFNDERCFRVLENMIDEDN
jgi:hypothetical protein